MFMLNAHVMTCRVHDVNSMIADTMKSRTNKIYYTSTPVLRMTAKLKCCLFTKSNVNRKHSTFILHSSLYLTFQD